MGGLVTPLNHSKRHGGNEVVINYTMVATPSLVLATLCGERGCIVLFVLAAITSILMEECFSCVFFPVLNEIHSMLNSIVKH